MGAHTLEALSTEDRNELRRVAEEAIQAGIDQATSADGYLTLKARWKSLQHRLETEIPVPAVPDSKKYVGRWFQDLLHPKHVFKVVHASSASSFWGDYVTLDCIGCPGRSPTCSARSLSDLSRFVEVPAKPTNVPDGYELTGEVRVPTDQDKYWMVPYTNANELYNAARNGHCNFSGISDADSVKKYRWIVRKIAPKYRPFKNAVECKHLIGEKVRVIKAPRSIATISGADRTDMWIDDDMDYFNYEYVLETYELLDGTPLGVKEA